MAISITCDGCGKGVPEGAGQFGLYKKVEYCPECAGIYKRFLADRDKEVASRCESLEKWLKEQRLFLKETRKFGRLPDE